MTDKDTGTGFGIAFVMGAAIGLVIGFLYAPRPGQETRELLKEKTELAKERAVEAAEKAKEAAQKAKEAAEEVKEKAQAKLGELKKEKAP